MIDVAHLQRLAGGDKAHIKENLSIVYVLERAGHRPARTAHGRISYHSPFRTDNSPSFDIWMSVDGERAGDFTEKWSGDVLDVLRRFAPEYKFSRIMDWANRLLREQLGAGWVAPPLPTPQSFDVELAAETLGRSITTNLSLVQQYLLGRSDEVGKIPAEWLRDEFRIGALGNRIIIPFFDDQDNLVCYKHRVPGEKPLAAPGSPPRTPLYGIWRGQDREKPVLLCEGETDTWIATYKVGDVFDVYGIPFGAGATPHYNAYSPLFERRVTIAFDADKAGDDAAKEWMKVLAKTPVTRALLPEGADLASIPGDLGWLPVPS